MNQATLNIRLPEDLKQRGSAVLAREGISVSQAVRLMYEYMDKHQCLPAFFTEGNAPVDKYETRRSTLRNMVGILPEQANLAEAREARLAAHGL